MVLVAIGAKADGRREVLGRWRTGAGALAERGADLQRALRRVWDNADSHDEARAELGALAESLEAEHPELAE